MPIATPTESAVKTQLPADSALGAASIQDLCQNEITEQNEKHLIAMIVATCVAVMAYIGYDYFAVPELWNRLVWWRLLDVVVGIAVLALFMRKRISALTAWAIFFAFNAAYLGYFASLVKDPVQLTVWNMNLSAAMFALPLALLTYPAWFNIGLVGFFVLNYLFWFSLNSPYSLLELLIYGGTFQLFAIFMALFGHWSKVRSAMVVAQLRFTVEAKNQEILEQNRKLEIKATYDALTGALNRGAGLKILEDRIRLNQRDGRDLTTRVRQLAASC